MYAVPYLCNSHLALKFHFRGKLVLNSRDTVSEIEPVKQTVTDCIFTTVNLQMLMALYAHREFHDLRARDVGVGRCSCTLCLNDDAAIQGAIKMEERYKPILQRAFS